MKDLRELEAQHEAIVSESATDDQKLRMHSEFKAICLMDETRLWSMELSDQQVEHLRCVTEMHVRFSENDNIFRQCSDDEGCLYTNLREVEWNFHHFQLEQIRLRIIQLECECLEIKCMLVEFDLQAGYEFGVSKNSVMQIPQESLVLVSSRVTSHSISGIPLDAMSVLDNSFLSDASGNLLNMILDPGAEEHSVFWTVWSLGGHDENSNFVRGSSVFLLTKQTCHVANDMDPFGDKPRTQWESITSCCRMLIGLETSKIVAVTLEFQFGSRIMLKTRGILCMLDPGNAQCSYSSGRCVLCRTSELTNNLSQELSKDMTMRWGMADDSCAKNFRVACWHPRESAENRLFPSHKNTSRYHKSLHERSQYYVTRTGAASTWKTCTVTATAAT